MSQQDIHSGSWAKSIFRVGKWYVLASLIVKGINAFTLPIFTHAMPPEELGIYSSINTLKNFIPLLVSLGLDGAFVRFFHEYKKDQDKLSSMFSTTFWFVSGFGVVISSVLFIIFSQVYSTYDLVSLAVVIFPPVFLQLGMLGIAFFNQSLESFRTTLFQIVATVIGVSVSIYLVVSQHMGVKGRLLGDALIACLLIVFVVVYFYRKGILSFRFNKSYLKQALLFSLPLLPVSLAAWVNTQSTQLLLQKYYPGQAVVGLFGLASSIALLMYYAVDAVTQVLSPVVMSGLIHDRERTHVKVRELMLLFTIVCLFLHLGLILFSKEIVMLFTANAKGYDKAYLFIAPLGVTYLFSIFHRLFNTIISFHNRNYFITIAVISGAICLFLSNVFLLPVLGPNITPVSILLGTLCMTGIEFYFARKLENVKLGLLRYIRFIVVYIITAIVAIVFLNHADFSWIDFAIKLTIYIVVAILFLSLGNYWPAFKDFFHRKFKINYKKA